MCISTFAIISDLHFPYQDRNAINAFRRFIKDKKVNDIILNGDILDFYDLSRFDKDPVRVNKLQEELNQVKSFLASLRELKPEANIVYVEGNHEDRLRRYLFTHPEISSLDNLKLERLLDLEKYDVRLVKRYKLGPLLLTHGSIVRQYSSFSAKGELEKMNTSGVSGHTHRLGSYYKSGEGFAIEWHEGGCLCTLNPEYMSEVPNWQQGFMYGGWEKGKKGTFFNIYPIKIKNGKILDLFK